MRILLTNDDGIRAPGSVSLHKALMKAIAKGAGPLAGAEVYAVAPATVQSATSHGVTFNEPLMTRATHIEHDEEGLGGFDGVAVAGRPADCVKKAHSAI